MVDFKSELATLGQITSVFVPMPTMVEEAHSGLLFPLKSELPLVEQLCIMYQLSAQPFFFYWDVDTHN
jgi:hypothetical protein